MLLAYFYVKSRFLVSTPSPPGQPPLGRPSTGLGHGRDLPLGPQLDLNAPNLNVCPLFLILDENEQFAPFRCKNLLFPYTQIKVVGCINNASLLVSLITSCIVHHETL